MAIDRELSAVPVRTRLARLLGVHPVERVPRTGPLGERGNAWWLGRLPERWFVLHDVAIGERGSHIEDLVVGPGGVFTITTKNLSGSIRVNPRSIIHDGHRTNHLPKAAAEARRVAQLLTAAIDRPVEVRGLIAILADEWIVNRLPDEVYVGGPGSAKHWMLHQPTVLRPSDVIVLVAAASRPETWTAPRHAQAASL